MRNKKLLITSFLFLLVLVMLCAVSCGAKPDEEEAADMVRELVSESYELNVIFFGKGLEFEDDNDTETLYSPVREDSKYKTKQGLIYKMQKVFSEDYSSSIINMAFNGVSGGIGSEAVFPRYMTGEAGYLIVYENIEGIEINEYDYSTIKITKISRRFIKAEITSFDGETVEVTLIKQDSEWRIDSATY